MESGFTVLCTGTRNAPLPSIPCLLTPYTYSCRKLNPSYLFFFPIHSMQQIHILVITGCLYTVPFEAHCKHRTDTLPEFFIVIFSPDISASCLILSGSFFPQLELSFVGFCGGSDVKNLRKTRVRSLGREDPLENEMANHSSVLAWRILWTEEPSGLCDPIDSSPPDFPSLGFSRQEHWSGLPFPSPMHKSESEVAQSCPTLCDPMDCSLPGSSIHGIFQARCVTP